MSDSLCECPFLQFAAEAERMTGAGIVPEDGMHAVNTRISAILVGRLRAEHGCTGPGSRFSHVCRYYYETHSSLFVTDPDVPLLKRQVRDGQDHKYI